MTDASPQASTGGTPVVSATHIKTENVHRKGFLYFCSVSRFAAGILWRTAPTEFLLAIATTLLGALAPVATIWVGIHVLDSTVQLVAGGWTDALVKPVYFWLAGQFLVSLGEITLQHLNTLLIAILGAKLSVQVRMDILHKTSALDMAMFDDPQFYDMITRARRESKGTPVRLLQRTQIIISGIVTFISMGGIIASISMPLFCAMIVLCAPLLVTLIRYSERQYRLEYTRTEESRRADYLSYIMTTRSYIPEIVNLNLWQHLLHKYRTVSAKHLSDDLRNVRQRSMSELAAQTLMVMGDVGAAGYILYLGMRVLPLSVGEITMYSRAFVQGLHGLRQSVEAVSSIYEDMIFIGNLAEYHRLEPHVKPGTHYVPVPSSIDRIEFQDVSFQYPHSECFALQDVNLCFDKCESTLLVGVNGSGKSTLLKLLLRLYDPSQGRILINGIDIREFRVSELQRSLGIMCQEYARFAVSARDNIGYGCIEEHENTDSIVDAANKADANTLISQLPHGYDTVLSKLYTDGYELSVGQWQRVCLARLYMKNAPVMIFDEPTASLDVETEAKVVREIRALSRNRICILVSHRMFQRNVADRVAVLNAGRIVESGPYETLRARDGPFAKLCNLYDGTVGTAVGEWSAT